MKINIEKLIKITSREQVKNDPADLFIYGSDASVHLSPASAVVQPDTVEQVQEIVKYANSEGIPVIARGAGSGMTGQTVPIKGGIVLDMKKMNRIL
ncbi:2-hydroxy-acid oxidase, partial [candidate division KSB1 bacterium]